MDFIEEVKYWVNKAREADSHFKVLGSAKHGYRFAPPISLSEVRAFEELHHLKLPENYVRVLTELGNGGAGPYYELYPLYEIEFDESEQIGSDVTFLDASLTPEIWKQAVRELRRAKDDDEYDELMRKIEANAVCIGAQGDYDTLLMCGGSENGKIISIDLSMDEYDPPRFTHMTFEEWYLSYFQEVAANHRIIRHGYTRLDTEEELIEAYEKAADMEPEARKNERREILSSLWRFQQLSADTINCLRRNPDESIIDSLISLILDSDKETGLAMFDERFYGEHPEKVILICRRSISDEIKDRYYQRALEILYTPEISARLIPAIGGCGEEPCAERLLFFLDDCQCKKAKDLLPYAKSDLNPDECRGTAAYVICKCPDAAQYQTEIAELMHSNVYRVAFNAMQGAIRAELREPVIMDAFRWMKEYYKDDKYIPSNLERIEGI